MMFLISRDRETGKSSAKDECSHEEIHEVTLYDKSNTEKCEVCYDETDTTGLNVKA